MKHLKGFYESNATIISFCKEYKIRNYTINKDNSIDVDGNVKLSKIGLFRIPLQFNIVTGNFDISSNKIESLRNSPKKVGGSFNCEDNQLLSLEHSPIEVGRSYICNGNRLDTLKGCPSIIYGDFYCRGNQLHTLEGSPELVGRSFGCQKNLLSDLQYGPIEVGGSFNCSQNLLVSLKGSPKEVGAYFACYDNDELVDIQGLQKIGSSFNAEDTPLGDLVDFFGGLFWWIKKSTTVYGL